MAKRLSFYQVPISPAHVIRGLNKDLEVGDGERVEDHPDYVDGTRTLDIPDGAEIYPIGWEHVSAGNPAAGTGILNLLVIESVT